MSEPTTEAATAVAMPGAATVASLSGRLYSLDAFRGAVMLLLIFFDGPNGDWRRPIAEAHENLPWVAPALRQFEHVEWAGLALWDMIQPGFMFAVGASLALSYAARVQRGQSYWRMFGHAVYRALLLILLGVFLRSVHRDSTNWTLEDVVTQIGLGYVPLFLLCRRGWKIQLSVAAGVLIGYWALFAFWPPPDAAYDYAAVNGQAYYEGFQAHWNKNAHPAHYFDQWLLNLFPRQEPFVANGGGYTTLNFVPSLATMILGLVCGELLGGSQTVRRKLLWLLTGGISCLMLGLALHYGGVCPNVKKLWTPSFALVSAGVCMLTLAPMVAVIDAAGWRRWAFPAIVVGQNSIAAYAMIHLIAQWTLDALHRHLGAGLFASAGEPQRQLVENLAVGAIIWLICYWMYRRRIFLRI
jgi:predicted acyltransferase